MRRSRGVGQARQDLEFGAHSRFGRNLQVLLDERAIGGFEHAITLKKRGVHVMAVVRRVQK